MNDKVRQLPLGDGSRKRLDRRQCIVRCEVTDYWLRFHPYAQHYPQGTFVIADVMQGDPEASPRRVCELVLSRDGLLSLVQGLPVRENS
jgi:hypothetical protein